MKKKGMVRVKKIMALLIMAGMIQAGTAQAATIDSYIVSDFDNSIVTVTGTIEEGEENIAVAIMPKGTSLKPGKYYGNSVTLQKITVADGKFSASFKFAAEKGTYTIKATKAESVDFEWIDKQSVIDFAGKLGNGEISDSKIIDELSLYSSSIGADISFAESAEEKAYLKENIKQYASRIKENGIEGVKNVVDLTRSESEFMKKLTDASVTSSVNKLIKEYAVSAEIDMSEYEKLTEEQVLKVCGKLIEGKFTDMDDFRKDFNEFIKSVKKKPQTGGSSGGSSGGSGGAKPSGTSLIIQPNPEEYADSESGKNARLFEIFTDVKDVSWGWEAILYTYDNGIMSGVGNNLFKPNDVLTREQFAKIITVAFDKYDENAICDFADIEKGNWATSYVASAKNAGFMNGVSETEFGFGKGLTREDICVVIYRAAKSAGMTFDTQKTDFSDYDEISDYAKEAVGFMAGKGIISGMGDGSFAPKGQATRAQAAKLIYEVRR